MLEVDRTSASDTVLECVNGRYLYRSTSVVSVVVAYIDLSNSKAFDSVSHTKLFAKLNAYGIRSNVLSWLEAYLKKTHSPD